MAELERAVEHGQRVAVTRRGSEYVVVARRLRTYSRVDILVGWLPMTGETIDFELTEIDSFDVLDS
jgi:hypothetical protein